jgi:hypothetical protein
VNAQELAAPGQINHFNRLRSAEIQATPIGVPLGTAVERIEGILAKELPPGFRYEWAGEADDLKETGGEIYFVLILAVLIVYMVLASQFESLVHPFTVILALPIGGRRGIWLPLAWQRREHSGRSPLLNDPLCAERARLGEERVPFVPRLPAMNLNLVFSNWSRAARRSRDEELHPAG